MSRGPRAPSLRREIVLGYTVVLVAALMLFAGSAWVILQQTLARTGTASLRETARTAEQLIVPAAIPRVAVREERVVPGPGDVEALRRRIRLATGDELDIYVARTGDVEGKALRSFALIALILIPVTAAVAALVARTLADRILEPLNRLVAASREVGIGGLGLRVAEPPRPAELTELASSFNGMLDRLQRAVETLRRFTADASHELRTPLTVIRGQAEVALARDRPPEELRETLGEILEETRSMLHLVEDLLALARGGEAEMLASAAPVDLVPLLHEVVDTGEVLAAGKPVALEVRAPDGPVVVHGAAGALRRLFLNLVSNAVKFTTSGSVIVTVDVEPEPAADEASPVGGTPPPTIIVSVSDTGAGIAADELPRVFDRFYRTDAARGHSGGTGLGLAIARMVAEQHGGSIEAESEPGRGSTFRVRLPAGMQE